METTADQTSGSSPLASTASLIATIKSDPFVLTMFFSLLLIGGDRIAIRAGGATLRLVFPLLMTAFAFLYQRVGKEILFDRKLTFLFFLLTLAGSASVIHSLDPVKSVGYTIWVLFDFFVIIALTYNFAKLYPAELSLGLWFLIYRIHAVLIIGELLLNVFVYRSTVRPNLWFYEPSYLAIFMAGYFGSALFMMLRSGKRYRLDFFLSLITILAMSSATGFFAILFAVLLNFIVARQRWMLLLVTVSLLALFLGTLYLFFRDTLYYQLIAGFLFGGNDIVAIFNLIAARGGNRWIRAVVGWQAFLRNPWLGVGIGGDTAYMGATPFPDSVAGYVQSWMDLDQGEPFSNIMIEVAGTMGIAGIVPVLGILGYAMVSAIRSLRQAGPAAAGAFFIAFFSIFLALQFESTFLRYYLWTPLGLAFGAYARARGKAAPEPAQKAATRTGPALA